MGTKLEKKLDEELEKMNVRPWIYHFTDTYPYRAVTIIMQRRQVHSLLSQMVKECCQYCNYKRIIQEMHYQGMYGIAICSFADEFNRERGRTIAKGRLLKYLKEK